jgi:hypothetical protein
MQLALLPALLWLAFATGVNAVTGYTCYTGTLASACPSSGTTANGLYYGKFKIECQTNTGGKATTSSLASADNVDLGTCYAFCANSLPTTLFDVNYVTDPNNYPGCYCYNSAATLYSESGTTGKKYATLVYTQDSTCSPPSGSPTCYTGALASACPKTGSQANGQYYNGYQIECQTNTNDKSTKSSFATVDNANLDSCFSFCNNALPNTLVSVNFITLSGYYPGCMCTHEYKSNI